MGNVHKLPFRWQVAVFLLALVVLFTAGGMWAPLFALARKAVADHQAAIKRSKPTDPTLRARTLAQAQAVAAEMRAHPERYRVSWQRTYKPTAQELRTMPWGAKGQQEVGTIYSGTLQVKNQDTATGPIGRAPTNSVGVSSAGASASIAWHASTFGSPRYAGAGYLGMYTQWRVSVTAGGVTDYRDYWMWCGDVFLPSPPPPTPSPISWEMESPVIAWSITLTGAYRRATITETVPTGTRLRHPAQRTGEGRYYADASTTVTVTCGDATATGNYGAGSETEITWSLGLTPAISYALAPSTYTPYGIITANMGGGAGAVAIDFSTWTFYRDSGSPSTWVWRGTTSEPGYSAPYAEGSQYWKTVPSGNTITVHRCPGIASGATAWGETAFWSNLTIVPRLWKQNKDATGVGGGYYRYTSYDESAGHPFELDLYRHTGETAADVSVAPSWTGYTYKWQTAFGTSIPEDVYSVFEPGYQTTVRLRADWLAANDEDVPFTDPLTGATATGDIRCPITFHDLTKPLTEPPWQTDWCTWTRTELDLDTPPGTSGTRPSDFAGSGGATVLGDVWTIPAAGGTIERTLATRRRNRMTRFASHQWPTLPEVSHDYPITTRANIDAVTAGDAAAWWDPETTPAPGEEPGVLLEDVTDWRGLSCVQLTCSGATANIALQLRLTYRTLSGDDPYYLGAAYNFGSSGEATAAWSAQKTATYRATLQASTGICRFDLAPKGGAAQANLELVEKVEFIFPVGAQTLTITGWATVPYDAAHPVSRVRMRNAHLISDYWGAESSIDGMPDYAPSYLYTMDSPRVETGYKRTQPLQHNPDYTGDPDDPTYLKVLTRFVNEQDLAQDLNQPVWNAAAADGDLEDGTGTAIGTPVWGDYDEDGFALHVGLSLDVPIPCRVVYCDVILQGGVRGIAKVANETRQVNKADTSITLQYSDDAGVTKTTVRQCGTGYAGEFHTGAGREKAPRTYYLKAQGTLALGGFVNAEELWAAVKIAEGGDKVASFRWPGTLVTWTCFIDGSGAIKLVETDEGHDKPGTVHTVDTSGDYDAVGATCDGVTIYVDAHKSDGSMWRFWSNDHGETWQDDPTGATGPTEFVAAA